MASEKSRLTDRSSVDKMLAGSDYNRSHGGDFSHWFKPFTTDTSYNTIPNYSTSIYTQAAIVTSGLVFAGADSSGLNPFGPHTLGEGLLFGNRTTASSGIDVRIDQNSVRTLGFKTPFTLVGWGYDIFGYPTPNGEAAWTASGVWNSFSTFPSTLFKSSGSNLVSHGSEVPYSKWEAGPIDLRFDINRKVWTSPQSVYAGRIKQAYDNSTVITNFLTPVLSANLAYDAEIFDGVANRITVTGVYPINPRPNVKVYPQISGSFCFIVHAEILPGRPGFAIITEEREAVFECSGSSSNLAASLLYSSNEITSLSSLVGNPLDTLRGGTGFDDFGPNTLLGGDPAGSGILQKLSIISGTGMNVFTSGTNITFQFSSGVLFTTGGINNSITELQGLTVPLSVGQGGTGASVKNFVDLYSDQLVGGHKTFSSGITIPTGSINSPTVKVNGQSKTGIYGTPSGIAICSSGIPSSEVFPYYTNLHNEVRILGTFLSNEAVNNIEYAPLVVSQFISGSSDINPIQIWKDRNNNSVSYLDNNGKLVVRSLVASGMTALMANSGNYNLIDIYNTGSGFANYTISAKNSSGNIYFGVNHNGESILMGSSGNQTTLVSSSGNRTINLASGYHGDIDVAKVGGGTRTLHLMYGLITGYTDS